MLQRWLSVFIRWAGGCNNIKPAIKIYLHSILAFHTSSSVFYTPHIRTQQQYTTAKCIKLQNYSLLNDNEVSGQRYVNRQSTPRGVCSSASRPPECPNMKHPQNLVSMVCWNIGGREIMRERKWQMHHAFAIPITCLTIDRDPNLIILDR